MVMHGAQESWRSIVPVHQVQPLHIASKETEAQWEEVILGRSQSSRCEPQEQCGAEEGL